MFLLKNSSFNISSFSSSGASLKALLLGAKIVQFQGSFFSKTLSKPVFSKYKLKVVRSLLLEMTSKTLFRQGYLRKKKQVTND